MWIILGDLKLVEKPTPMTMAPHDFCNIKANVKVASTENGIIFGNIGKISMKNFSLFSVIVKKRKKRWTRYNVDILLHVRTILIKKGLPE